MLYIGIVGTNSILVYTKVPKYVTNLQFMFWKFGIVKVIIKNRDIQIYDYYFGVHSQLVLP